MSDASLNKIHDTDIIEISLNDIISFFAKYLFRFLITSLLFFALGYGYSYLITPRYTSSAKILPEYGTQTSSTNGLSDLASLAGIRIGKNNSDALRPDLYPQILSSKPFLLKLLSTPFILKNGQKIFLITYLNKKSEPLTLKQIAQGDSIIELTNNQEISLKIASSLINSNMDKLSGVINITVEMTDPYLAAACTVFTLQYLKDFVSDYRGGKEIEKVNFLKKQLLETKLKYRNTEIALNSYRDQNRSQYTNLSRVEEQRLQSDYLQTQSVYAELSRQLETAKLQALEDKPVLKILEPPMIPNKKSKPQRLIIAMGTSTIGLFLAIIFSVSQVLISTKKNKKI